MKAKTHRRQLPHGVNIAHLRAQCPLPTLLKRMHLDAYAQSSCLSPLRDDKEPSWGIYQHAGRHYWKDLATGDHGDEIDFLARYLGLDPTREFPTLVRIYAKFASGAEEVVVAPEVDAKPSREGFSRGSDQQLSQLSLSRGISLKALSLAQDLGFLLFGQWHGLEVYGVTDQTGNVLELRRLDGKSFPQVGSLGERKSHALKGSSKSWPVGIMEAKDHPAIMLLEGVPDFLAAFQVLQIEGGVGRVAPVAMLSAGASIAQEAIAYFAGKVVRIFPHADAAGKLGAGRWEVQLREVGAVRVDQIDFGKVGGVKDLCDCLALHQQGIARGDQDWRLLP